MQPEMAASRTNKVGDLAVRISSECVAFRLRVMNRAISRIYDEALRPFGLRIAQLNTLVVVMETGGITPNELSNRMHMDASTVSRNVERMCNNGWLELVCLEDARSHEIRITAKGKRLLKEVGPAWNKAQSDTQELIGKQVMKSVFKGAQRIDESNE